MIEGAPAKTSPAAASPGAARAVSGHTLLELVTVLALLAVATAVLSRTLIRYRDVAAVISARESVAGLIASARAAAVASGGATVHVRAVPPIAALVVAGDTARLVDLSGPGGVEVRLGARSEVALHFDEVGLGRLANATILFGRGGQSRALVVSSFGRVRRP